MHLGEQLRWQIEVFLQYSSSYLAPEVMLDGILRPSAAAQEAHVGGQVPLLVSAVGTPSVPHSAERGGTNPWGHQVM